MHPVTRAGVDQKLYSMTKLGSLADMTKAVELAFLGTLH